MLQKKDVLDGEVLDGEVLDDDKIIYIDNDNDNDNDNLSDCDNDNLSDCDNIFSSINEENKIIDNSIIIQNIANEFEITLPLVISLVG